MADHRTECAVRVRRMCGHISGGWFATAALRLLVSSVSGMSRLIWRFSLFGSSGSSGVPGGLPITRRSRRRTGTVTSKLHPSDISNKTRTHWQYQSVRLASSLIAALHSSLLGSGGICGCVRFLYSLAALPSIRKVGRLQWPRTETTIGRY